MRLALVLLLCASSGAADAAQGPTAGPAPPRDPRPSAASAPTIGDARLFGRVIDAETARPLRGALVVAVPQRRADGSIVADIRAADALPTATRTDADGRFALVDLAPGEYALVARRDGYVQQQLGQVSANTPGRNIVVAMGAVAGPLEFALVRSAVISGRVVDPNGLPADRVTVRASRLRGPRGGAQLRPIASTTTDDLGEFRIFGLAPGTYVVSAEPVRASRRPDGIVSVPERGLVATFAPSATAAQEAQAIRVGPGNDAEAHIHLVEATLATVAGRVIDSRGAPVTDAYVGIVPRGVGVPVGGGSLALDGEGRFTWKAVPPGAYTLTVSRRDQVGTGTAQLERREFGALDVDVAGDDVTGVLIRTLPGTIVRGRVIVDGDASPLRGRDVRVQASSIGRPGTGSMQARAPLRPDLTFELVGVHGPAVLRLSNAPDGWWTRTVRVGRVDATDGVDFGVARSVDVEIVVSTKGSGFRGRVITPAPGPPVDALVIGFDEDARRWGRPIVANTFMVRPVENGAWSIDRLRPGTYRLVAVSAARAGDADLEDPGFLTSLAPLARTVVLAEGDTPQINLEVQQP